MSAPAPAQLRALFFAVPPARRQASPDLRLARVEIAGEWFALGTLSSLEVEALTAATTPASQYAVTFYARPGVLRRVFASRVEAETFATGKTYRSLPASVEVL